MTHPPATVPVTSFAECLARVCLAPASVVLKHEAWVRALLLDTLGCAVAARGHAAVAHAAVAAAALGAGTAARGLGSALPLSASGVVLDSGAAIRALDYNDFYWGPGIGGHPSDLFAVGLSLAQRECSALGELLGAMAVGYEIYLRILDRMDADGAFDHTSAMGLAGAALGARLMRLDETRTAHALAMAAVLGPSMYALRQGAICEAKAAAPALASLGALAALDLARAGMTGPVHAAGGPRGLGGWLPEPQALAAPLEATPAAWRLAHVSIKRYPCIGTAQAAVHAACEMHRAVRAAGGTLEAVQVRLTRSTLIAHQTSDAYRRPDDRETADHSFFSLMSMALCDGDLTPGQFERGRYRDPDVLRMSDRLRFDVTLPPREAGQFCAELQARLDDGHVIDVAVDRPPGHPLAPLSADELLRKWRACCEGRIGAGARDALAQACLHDPLDVPVARLLQPLLQVPIDIEP